MQVPFAGQGSTLTAIIPSGATQPGSMVRWAVQTTLADGSLVREPPMRDANETSYWGTVVPNPATASPGGLPVMEW